MPSVLFLFVSYMQFWVAPNIAPARAFLAVIPVLIMRTLSNSVYTTLPEGSQCEGSGSVGGCSSFFVRRTCSSLRLLSSGFSPVDLASCHETRHSRT